MHQLELAPQKNDPATAAPANNSILYCDEEKQLVRDAR